MNGSGQAPKATFDGARPWRRRLATVLDVRALAFFAAAAVVALRLQDPAALQTLRFEGFDLLQQVAPRDYARDDVAIVDIDEASIAELGQWPWDRGRLADLVERLDAAGAKAIGFDIVFSEPDRLSPPAYGVQAPGLPLAVRGILAGLDDTDARFARAIADAPVALGLSGSIDVMGAPVAASAAPAAGPGADRVVFLGGDPRPRLFAFPSFLRNIPELEAAAKGLGSFSLTPEPDGVVRRVPAAMRAAGEVAPSLAIETMRVGFGAPRVGVELDPHGGGVAAMRLRGLSLPTDRNGRFWLRFAHHNPALYVSAADLLGPGYDPAAMADKVRGKFVLIGTSAIGLRDIRMTPLDQSIPGVEIHAQVIDAALSGELLTRPDLMIGAEHLAALAGCLLLIAFAPKLTAARGAPVIGLLLAGYGGVAWTGFAHGGFAFDATYPAAAAAAVFAVIVFANFTKAERQRRRIRSAFSQYLSPDLVAQLADDPDRLALGGESRHMTFLFCDIAGFTSFVEKAEPAALVRLLNEYLDGVCRIVMAHGGTIDKIVGDAVHAMFNAPLDDPDHGRNAVKAALEIEAFVKRFREEKRAEGYEFGETRIGVNAGRAIVGNFGGARRFDYTAHGDAINTAARLEGANKHLGTSIIVSDSVAAMCPDIAFRPIGDLYLKGKDKPVGAFEPVRPGREDQAEAYGAAFALLAQTTADGADAAREAFAELFARDPDDPLAKLHCRRLENGGQGAAIVMAEK